MGSNVVGGARRNPRPRLMCRFATARSSRESPSGWQRPREIVFPIGSAFSQRCWKEYKKRLLNALREAHARADAAVCTIQAAYYRYKKKVSIQNNCFVCSCTCCLVGELGLTYHSRRNCERQSFLCDSCLLVNGSSRRAFRSTGGVVGGTISEEEK